MVDSHAHYSDRRFDPDREELLSSLPGRGVEAVLCCGSDIADSRAALLLAERYPYIYAACGIHPHESAKVKDTDYDELRALLKHKKCAALGEIGLDYHYDFSPREKQKACFYRQLELAAEFSLPVVVHDREAHADILDMLRELRPAGVVHSFSGSLETARELLDLGMYLGFNGMVTFKNAKRPLAAAAAIPLDRLLLETDAPYMTPEPWRGRRCDSAHIPFTAARIAEARGISTEELTAIANENARRLFKIV
ncbi:MAG: TatD family hydrolase [Oscillospiraceae bacterium]|nr:TatD family hydrolase [Oscillospiraceae bacterium]